MHQLGEDGRFLTESRGVGRRVGKGGGSRGGVLVVWVSVSRCREVGGSRRGGGSRDVGGGGVYQGGWIPRCGGGGSRSSGGGGPAV